MDYAVVMAGGTGKRLWPLSRRKRPKQVLKILDGQTLLRKCFQRLTPVFDTDNIIILTNAAYVDIVRENLPELPACNVIAEPAVRDTASAIGLAATVLAKADPEANMAVVTADQLIEPAETLQQALKDGLAFVHQNPESLITFGIEPTFANTQLGYINCVAPCRLAGCENEIYTVKGFKEKPDQPTAEQYLLTGEYFWNSGMFIWKAATILDKLAEYLPDSTGPLQKIRDDWDTDKQQATLNEWFLKLPKISIDYAVMEKTNNVHAIKLNCRWVDMGSYNVLEDFTGTDSRGNVIIAEKCQAIDCSGSIIVTEDKSHLIAAIGLDNIIVAHTPDATLVCRADQSQRLKDLLDLIEQNGGEEFL